MKLLNHTLSYLSVTFLVVIGVWGALFYFSMLDEIYDSIDDGLENSKVLIIQKAQTDSSVFSRTDFMESNYAIHKISKERALSYRETYLDTTLYMVNEEDYEPVRILKTAFRSRTGDYYELHVVSSMVEEDDLIESLLYWVIYLYIILLGSVLLINNILLKKIWKPFYSIVERVRSFSLESPNVPPPVETKVSEFKILNDSVTSLLNRSLATFNSQKQFIENASHELQTPLAISINRLELLAEKESMSEGDLHEVSSVIQSLERLVRLNKTLLLLSKIDNRQFPDQSQVNMNEIADRVVADLSELAEYKSVTVKKVYAGTLTRNMNPELASTMILNLLKNAIIHNVERGEVVITIEPSQIRIDNTGPEKPLDGSQIFKRFYKHTASTHSTGLGLSIVKSIADYYGLTVRYQFNGRHEFIIDTM